MHKDLPRHKVHLVHFQLTTEKRDGRHVSDWDKLLAYDRGDLHLPIFVARETLFSGCLKVINCV